MNLKKIVLFIGPSFEDREYIYPYYRFQEAGFQVDVLGPKKNETYVGLHGLEAETNLGPDDLKVDDYDVFVVTGGHAPDRMRQNEKLVNIIKEAFEKDKIVAAICHGPQLLIEADVLKGKRATSYRAIVKDVKNAGAIFEDKPVVVDGKLVTSRHPRDLPEFTKAILKLISY